MRKMSKLLLLIFVFYKFIDLCKQKFRIKFVSVFCKKKTKQIDMKNRIL